MMAARLSRRQMAWRIAQDLADGMYVNLGIGMPEMIADHLPAGREVVLHSENGLLGMGPSPAPGDEDPDLTNAGKRPVTLLPGGVYFHHTDSFVMVRGGHLDLCVMGAYQVSMTGDLANWATDDPNHPPAVGGAMDLAAGARQVYVMMEHTTREGVPKIVERCTYPLTGAGVVDRIYSDLAVIEVTGEGLLVREMVAGIDLEGLQAMTAAPLALANDWRPLTAPAL